MPKQNYVLLKGPRSPLHSAAEADDVSSSGQQQDFTPDLEAPTISSLSIGGYTTDSTGEGVENIEREQESNRHFNTHRDTRSIIRDAEAKSFYTLWTDPDCRSIYGNFVEAQISTHSLLVLAIFITLTIGSLLGARLFESTNPTMLFTSIVGLVRISQSTMTVILSWVVWYLKRARKYDIKNWFIDQFSEWTPLIQAVATILWSTCSATILLQKATMKQCGSFHSYGHGINFDCNINHDTGGLPLENIASTLLFPLAIFTLLPDTKLWALLTAFSISLCSLIIAGSNFEHNQMISGACIYLICGLLIIYETQRQKVALFLVADKLYELLAENERTAEETHATELRHMIANVAHDLKTPLSSFTSGVDMIGQILADCKATLAQSLTTALDPQRLLEHVDEIAACVGDIQSTNAFMLMTINRCIDYTKASKGIQLVPKLETVDLQDAINLPLRVVNSLKATVRIFISPRSTDPSVCSHVITDKQWLQENLLCLLSNAIKYSSRGSVNIAVGLVDAEAIQPLRTSSKNAGKVFRSRSNSSFVSPVRAVFQFTDSDASKSLPDIAEEDTEDWSNPMMELLEFPSPQQQSQQQQSTSSFLRFEVEDTGIGLSADARRNLFKPFKQAQRLAGGTGLGLFSLAKRMEALGGYYGVDTRRDKKQGSLFWFAFPYRPDTESAATAATATAAAGITNTPTTADVAGVAATVTNDKTTVVDYEATVSKVGSLDTSTHLCSNEETPAQRILLVDDSLSVLKMTKMVLKRHKYEVITAENGMEALEIMTSEYIKLMQQQQQQMTSSVINGDPSTVSTLPPLQRKAPFDLVLMDMNMPVMDGLESVKRIRKLEKKLSQRLSQSENTATSLSLVNRHTTHQSLGVAENGKSETPTAAASATSDCFHQFIIGVSANSDQKTLEGSQLVGMEAFIPKPFKIELMKEIYQQHHK